MKDLLSHLRAMTSASTDEELWAIHVERMAEYGFDRLLYGFTRYHTATSLGDPQAPWQKGSVESLNKHARRYLPRDTPIAALSNLDTKAICDRLNRTPRNCLGWRTPAEAFAAEIRNLR